MEVRKAYDLWAAQYDTNENKTRDLEALALRKTLANVAFSHCLEIGCGTGKNTAWLSTRAKKITAVDLSGGMLAKAKKKIAEPHVEFLLADINQPWVFANGKKFDLATFSLVLEHIEDLEAVFGKLPDIIDLNGHVYIGELHPFKQYTGSKARFETEEGVNVVTCFIHHVSDFTGAAKRNGFEIVSVDEYFDGDDRTGIPRILVLLLRRIDG